MVEKNGLCPLCRKENIFDDTNLSWKELRGLSWLFCEDCLTCKWSGPKYIDDLCVDPKHLF